MKQLFRDRQFVAIISVSTVIMLVFIYLSFSSKSDLKKIQQKKEMLKKKKQDIFGYANVNENNLNNAVEYNDVMKNHVEESLNILKESSIKIDYVDLKDKDSREIVTMLNSFDSKIMSSFEDIGVNVESFDYKLAVKYDSKILEDEDKKKEVMIQLYIVKTIMSVLQSQGSNLKSIVSFSRVVDKSVKNKRIKKSNKVINGYEIIPYKYKIEIKADNVLSFLKAFAKEKRCFILASLDDEGYASNVEVDSSNKNSYFAYNNQSISLILTVYDCVKKGDK